MREHTPAGPAATGDPPSTSSVTPSPAAPYGGRIKRNTACNSCRDTKVKCNPSSTPGQPCLRCSKLQISCVVDKTHKRVSRRSKLEELVKEVQNIKQAVGDRPPSPPKFPAPLPPIGGLFSNGPEPRSYSPVVPAPDLAAETTLSRSSLGHSPVKPLLDESVSEPSLPRALGSRPFSGDDIDHYFTQYFQYFHSYMPIIRQRSPNVVYETGQLLFWTIILIACRHGYRGSDTMSFLTREVRREIFAALGSPPLSVRTIQAMVLLCAWPLPDIRFVNDPTPYISGAALNACLLEGLHTGRGGHPEYSFGVYQTTCTDEEAVFTWAGFNIVSQRVSSYLGYPALGNLFNHTIQQVIEGQSPVVVPHSFKILLECQKWTNRASHTINACLESAPGVPPSVVRHLETEFDKIRGSLYSHSDDFDAFNILITLLDLQVYSFIPLSSSSSPSSIRNDILRAFNTSQEVIRQALELDNSNDQTFLRHAPHFYFRSILTASSILFKLLRTTFLRDGYIDRESLERSAQDSIVAIKRCSVQDGDLAARIAGGLESWWEIRSYITLDESPVAAFSQRLSAGIVFDSLSRWKNDLAMLRPKNTAAGAGGQNQNPESTLATSIRNVLRSGVNTPITQAGESSMVDPLMNIDWNLMDELDWNFDTSLLNLP